MHREQKSPPSRGAHTHTYTAISSDRRHGLGREGPSLAHDEDTERIVWQLSEYWQWPQRCANARQWYKTLPPPSTSRAVSVGGTDAPTRPMRRRGKAWSLRAHHRHGLSGRHGHASAASAATDTAVRRPPLARARDPSPVLAGPNPTAPGMRAPEGMGPARNGHCHVFATPPRTGDSARDPVSSSPSLCPLTRPRPHLVVSCGTGGVRYSNHPLPRNSN